ncbi:PREDICTED: uncharacterized protein LOC109581290 isoform X2 [Amphimedon queenslandica]|uniref:OCIA domain-containing protein n=1 Tax=Amphimedon queenslandica TaxID=400682 RepID=A0A1X7V3C8_AMPQE|nr:PREDICTED: uncharacterized protein LOC109581290 isoform X2 [Amphimedon queenslandica]|eukprot:XP_019850843.1 PREDICTED: uncharacterized protein LOC109581290 isoform X2 [Amphimedon queenslandica]
MASDRHSYSKAEGKPKIRIQLNEEEKAVLVECRRNSLIRGAAVGLGSILGLRYLMSQGKVPAHVMRWPVFYYSGVFFLMGMLGVSSYRKRCLDKLMALENSNLANMMRDIKAGRTPNFENRTDNFERKGALKGYPDTIIDKDESQVSSLLKKEDENAFPAVSSSSKQPPLMGDFYNDKKSDDKKGKTFDEIREENRAKQMQRRYPQRTREDEGQQTRPQSTRKSEGTNVSRPVKRNEYGDIVYDDK